MDNQNQIRKTFETQSKTYNYGSTAPTNDSDPSVKRLTEQNFESINIEPPQPTVRPVGYQFQHRRNHYSSGQYVSFNQLSQGYFQPSSQANFNTTPYTQSQPAINMNVIVVTKEEIEAPWRQECEYLQSIIQELEQNSKVEVVKEYVENTEKVTILESERNSLRDQINQLRGENQQLRDQLDRKNKEIQSLNQTVDSQKLKINDWESRYNSVNSELLKLRAQLDQDSRGLRQQYDAAQSELIKLRAQYDAEVSRLKQLLDDKTQDCYRLKRELDDRNQTIQLGQQRMIELERDLQMIQAELDRSNLLLKDRNLEIERLKAELERLRAQLDDTSKSRDLQFRIQQLSTQIDDLSEQLKSRTKECDSYRVQMRDQETDFQRRYNELINRIRELENGNLLQSNEIDRLNGIIRQLTLEIENWNIRYTELEAQGVTVIEEKVTYLTQEVEVWKERFIKVNHDYNKTQEDLMMAQAELESYKKGLKKETMVTTRTVRTQNSSALTSGSQFSHSTK